MLSKPAIKIAMDIIQNGVRQKNKTVAAKYLSSKFGIGKYNQAQKCYLYNSGDVDTLKIILSAEGIDYANILSFSGSRNDVAIDHVDEKHSREAVFASPVCIKVLTEGCEINNIKLTPFGLGHIQINIPDVNLIDADHLILVENLETFKRLNDVILPSMPEKTLYLWRGGPTQKNGAKLSIANTEKLAKKWKTQFQLKTGYFGDYDLKGISIGVEAKSDFLLLPDISEVQSKKIKGNTTLYNKQIEEFTLKRNQIVKYKSLEEHVCFIENMEVGFTQERMSAHHIPHSWITLK
ncbi:MAG: hypothetical protein COA63_001405 [Methylophaga sp.]|nr:hypothetical protein [Methylophaga sp.]